MGRLGTRMSTFEVEYREGLSEWEPAGEAEATGKQAAYDAIGQLMKLEGSYRARLKDGNDYPWSEAEVTMDGATGRAIIRPIGRLDRSDELGR